ncbi:AsnC family transcriptional regulator [Desulfuribacillus stibiiarsenatis]|uniref:siroheme decarboxylase n=1 Tax=Desulfuribacillus stibiiarsenatis TaxID=1390249 RepID=A0A1E5L2D0_9FIRM|nr:AsnC family transcriptional regulator [Desulfuribacillus stibiiarsenatis]OEH84201.1 AsnC family transcriptional regulator [Desulfuribacillus stibiiarsenatis]
MDLQLDQTNKKLLNLLQSHFPLVEQPFQELANLLEIQEQEVMERIEQLKKDKVIRQISAIFDTKSLGYQSSLVAAKVKPDHLEKAAEIINQHPGVSHNYERAHEFNLWFTIAIPPNSNIGLEQSVELLGELAGVDSIRLLPTLKLFKIGVKLDLESDGGTSMSDEPVYNHQSAPQNYQLSDLEIQLVRELQENLHVTTRPFDAIADRLGISVADIVGHLQNFKATGLMRRFAAVLHHRTAGFQVNTMGVWAAPEDRIDEVGETLAKFSSVSHCYRRPSYPDWPFNVFTMIHGRDKEDCENILTEMAAQVHIDKRDALYSVREFKKIRVKYFTPEIEAWEEVHRRVK